MTNRQQALFHYLQTIRPELEGSRDHAELIERIMRCVIEDGGFVVGPILADLKARLQARVVGTAERFVERKVEDGIGLVSSAVSSFVQGLFDKKR
jgi:hypothetical protein